MIRCDLLIYIHGMNHVWGMKGMPFTVDWGNLCGLEYSLGFPSI